MNKSIYIFDKSLIPRIQKYLDDNVQNEYISIDVMADYLQKSYRDYTRRNRNAFHKSVHDAYAVIMKNYGISESEVIACTDSSDLEEVETPQNQSTDLVDMYMKNTPKESDDNSPRLNVITPRIEGIKIRSKKRRIESDIKSIETAVSKKKAKDVRVPLVPEVTFNDIAGMNRIMEELGMLLLHMKRPEIYREIGELPPRGILLHGPVGCGKTLLAHAIAGELKVTLLKVSAPELVAGVAGESEERIRELFQKAKNASPCVLFIDQIDAISQSRQHAQKEMERRIVAQLLTCFDDLNKDKSADQILVIGATNRADGLDSALRREGRFDTELCLGVPDFEARIRILKILTEKLKLSEDFNYETVAKLTPGYVGADLVALKKRATLFAIKRISLEKLQGNENALTERNLLNEVAMWWDKDLNEQGKKGVDKIFIELEDFLKAVKVVQPSSKREGFATVPNITWDDIGSLADIRQELQLTILASIRYTKECESLGITASTGVLLCGPPGCGKTLLAKAIANEAGINFISVKGPELLNMYVGESERAVRQCFARARTSAPCVIFFDELDALCPKRSDSRENNASSRVVNQMLTEMDGVEERLGVYILAASNRPDIVDPAILRPGRLDKILYVGLPTPEDRVDILKTITKNGTRPKLDSNVDLDIVGSSSILEGYTGADLAALVHEASTEALKEIMTCSGNFEECAQVSLRHFKRAAAKIRPSVNEKDRKQYEKLKERYGTKSSRKEAEEIDF